MTLRLLLLSLWKLLKSLEAEGNTFLLRPLTVPNLSSTLKDSKSPSASATSVCHPTGWPESEWDSIPLRDSLSEPISSSSSSESPAPPYPMYDPHSSTEATCTYIILKYQDSRGSHGMQIVNKMFSDAILKNNAKCKYLNK